MHNSENEKECIIESLLLKNKDSDKLMRKTNDQLSMDNCADTEFKDGPNFAINNVGKKFEEMVEEGSTSEYLLEDIGIFEAKNDLLNNGMIINKKVQRKDLQVEVKVGETQAQEQAEKVEENDLHIKGPKKRKKKPKKQNDNNEASKPMKQMIRINYLVQASFQINKFSPNISREYIKTMRRLSNKFLIKYDRKFKKLFCKKCNSVLIPGETCKVSVNPLNLKKKKVNKNEYVKDSTSTNKNFKARDEYLVSYTCNLCEHNTKFVYDNNLAFSEKMQNGSLPS
ncbi:ribonuclease P protein subunit RPR2, putative (RPR2) [Plasmodium ovale curtisi]|uniref:Ribonuclease P protein subunit RPR2, putative (RPR2) n=1 Tax=Plasmodium ovale curtisi TaxID=864141 RepID=A0A1A8WU37_PLAOA|nr:ribonuclease P protein subunit RPR2, putative (RPR2) [Plasmodium ovale curtisi]